MKRSCSMPFGAEVSRDGSVRFRLWAPQARRVELCLENGRTQRLALAELEGGWFELSTGEASPGTHYRFQIDGDVKVPDPASRFQPFDVHGPSEVVNPGGFDWQDDDWIGRPWEEAVIYELHVGAFTPEGAFHGVEQKLDYLRDLGVTAIELMPVADFPGARNWGYDGVLLYAPDSSYGRPEDLKRLIQAAHARGLMVFLDVVYNHFGPEGNYLHVFSPQFFTDRHRTPWGDAINFAGPESGVVRDFFVHNALYWLDEYHFDGLRLDAVHAIRDDSTPDILTELALAVRDKFGDGRYIHLILENGDNAAHYLRRDAEGRVLTYNAQWNDDLHHALHVVITGESDGYYSDYARQPLGQLCRCLAEGFAYQGDYSEFHGADRGEPSAELPPSAFVSFLQNHDQVGNRAFGERILQLAPPQALRAALEILLLAPAIPLLFMGEEFGADSPFLFFCDFHGELAAAVTQGRRNEFAHFRKFNAAEVRDQIPDPNAEQTYLQSKLDWDSVHSEGHAKWLHFYRDLLSLRQRVVVPHLRGASKARIQSCEDKSRGVLIGWELANGVRLDLRANPSDEPLARAVPHAGEPFRSSSPEQAMATGDSGMAPWSVTWSLRS
jgi:maltooligosyltrehalose trehalohydrolase